MAPIRAKTACQKCRALKHKCDFKFPKCTRCDRAGTQCLVQDRSSREYKPREDFPEDLEVEALPSLNSIEQRLLVLEGKVKTYERIFENLGIDLRRDAALGMSQISILSLIPFGRSGSRDHELTSLSVFGGHSSEDPIIENVYPLPSKEECAEIIINYYKFAWVQHPVVENEQVLFSVAQSHSSATSWESFLLYICLAIGTAITGDSSDLARRYYISSITYLKRFLYSIPITLQNCNDKDISNGLLVRSLQSLLLICSFGLLKPISPGIWYMAASAMRLCIDLDLQDEANVVYLDEKLGPEGKLFHRRLFWSCYSLERQICGYANKPFSLNDGDITTKMVPFGENELSYLFIKSRQMQSTIHQDRSKPFGASAHQWRQNMHSELNNWLVEVLRSQEVSFSKTFLLLTYFQLMISLYRPIAFESQLVATHEFQILLESANSVINIYDQLHYSGKINYKYLSVYSIYQSGLTFFYCLINSPELSLRPNMLEFCDKFMQKVSALVQGLQHDCPPARNTEPTLSKVYQTSIEIIKVRLKDPKPTAPMFPTGFGLIDMDAEELLKSYRAIPLMEPVPDTPCLAPSDSAELLKTLNLAGPTYESVTHDSPHEFLNTKDLWEFLFEEPFNLKEMMMLERA